MKKSEFVKEVEHEIKMLKIHATKRELNKLNFQEFSPNNREECIYGQISGQCNSERAKELMDKCCIKAINFFNNPRPISFLGGIYTFKKISNFTTDYDSKVIWDSSNQIRDYYYLSALECYIGLKGSNNKDIFDYLTGKTEILNLK